MVIDVVNSYRVILNNIAHLIEVSGYRQDYLSKKLGLKAATFSAKKQKGNWTPEEVEHLLSVIANEDVEDYMLMKFMENLEDEETVSYEEFKSQLAI